MIDHRVDDLADAQEFAAQRAAFDLDRHLLRQIALGDRPNDARDLRGRLDHVVDQLIDRAKHAVPSAGGAAHFGAVVDLAFLADDFGQAIEFAGDLLVEPDHFVEQDRDLAFVVSPFLAQPDGEVAAPQFA